MSTWGAQFLQLAWFGQAAEGLKSDLIFEKAFGLPAETTQTNRVPNPSNPFWNTASGRVEDKMADVQIQPGRLDIIVTAGPSSDQEIPLLDVSAAISLIEPASMALAAVGEAMRVAVISEVVSASKNYAEAIAKTQLLTGLDALDDETLDFSFQINKRIPFPSTEGRTMNRVVRWGTSTYQAFRLEVGQAMSPTMITMHAASVHIDLNNVPNGDLIDSERQIAMYEALGTELHRLAQHPALESL